MHSVDHSEIQFPPQTPESVAKSALSRVVCNASVLDGILTLLKKASKPESTLWSYTIEYVSQLLSSEMVSISLSKRSGWQQSLFDLLLVAYRL
jgi:hypothetical protein